MAGIDPKFYNCPGCGQPVEAKADYLARGMRCPSCGVGFIPERIELAVRKAKPKASPASTTAGAVGLVMVLAGIAALLSIWLGIGLAVVGLLAIIAVQLGTRKSE